MFEKEKCAALLEISNIKLRVGFVNKGTYKKTVFLFSVFSYNPKKDILNRFKYVFCFYFTKKSDILTYPLCCAK